MGVVSDGANGADKTFSLVSGAAGAPCAAGAANAIWCCATRAGAAGDSAGFIVEGFFEKNPKMVCFCLCTILSYGHANVPYVPARERERERERERVCVCVLKRE